MTGFVEDCRKVADSVASDFPEVEAEYVFRRMVGVLAELDAEFTDPFLLGVATQICWEVRREALSTSVQYDYRPSDVEKILETAWLGDTDKRYVPVDALSMDDHDGIEIAADIKWALEGLSWMDRIRIRTRYELGIEPRDYHREALQRAVGRLTDRLNSYSRGG